MNMNIALNEGRRGTKSNINLEILLFFVFLSSLYFFMSTVIQFIMIIILVITYTIKYKYLQFNRNIIFYMMFLFVAGLSGIYGGQNDNYIGNMITLILCFTLIFVIPGILGKSQKKTYVVIDSFVILGLAISAYTIYLLDFNSLLNSHYHATNVLANNLGNRNSVALMLALSFNFSCYNVVTRKMYKYSIIPIVLITTILLTGSNKGLLLALTPLMVSFSMFYFREKGIISWITRLLILFILLAGVYFIIMEIDIFYNNIGWRIDNLINTIFSESAGNDGSIITRKFMIEKGLDYFKKRPIFGYGIENFRYLYAADTGWETYSHNNYVELLVNNGVVGIITYYSFFISTILTAMSKQKKSEIMEEQRYYALIISMLISILIIDVSLISYKWMPLYILFGLSYKLNWNND